MAFVSNNLMDEEEDKKTGEQGREQLASGGGGFIAPGGTGGGGAQGTATPGQEKTASGSWTNLRKYIDANSGPSGSGAQMAGKVADTAKGRVSAFQGKASDYENRGVQAIQGGAVKKDDGLIGALKSAPTQVDKGAFQKAYNASYAGPKSAAEFDAPTYAGLSNEASGIRQDLSDTTTDQGRQRLADTTFGRPGYSRGEKTLDSFLLQTAGGDKLAELRDTASKFDEGFQGVGGRLDSAAQRAQQESLAARDAVRSAYDEAFKGTRGSLEAARARAEAANQKNDTAFQQFTGKLGSGNLAEKWGALGELGVDEDTARWLSSQGYDPRNFVSDAKNFAAGDFVSEEDQARYAALQGLMDRGVDFDFSKAGGVDRAYDVATDKVNSAKGASALERAIAQRFSDAQAKRTAEYAASTGNLDSLIKNYGLNADDIAFYSQGYGADKEALEQFINMQAEMVNSPTGKVAQWGPGADVIPTGFDPKKYSSGQALSDIGKFTSKGRDLSIGDVATEGERKQWASLLGTLGLQGKLDLSDPGDEGGAASFNKALFEREVAARRQELKNLRAIADRKAAERRKLMGAAKKETETTERDVGNGGPNSGDGTLGGLIQKGLRKLSDERRKTSVHKLTDDEIAGFVSALKKGR